MTRLPFPALLLMLAVLGALPIRAEIVDRIAAIVDDEIITLYEVEKEAQQALLVLRQQNAWTEEATARRAPEVKKQILEGMIREKLFEHEVAKLGIPVTDGDIDEYLQYIAQRGGITVEQLNDMIRKEGKTVAEYRELVKKKIQREQYVQYRVKSGATEVSDAEIRNYYNQHRDEFALEPEVELAEIRVAAPLGSDDAAIEDARRRAEMAHALLAAGEPFAKVAAAHSDAPSAAAGGRLGWFKLRTELRPAYSRVAQTLEPGATSAIARDEDGFFLLQLLARKEGAARPLEEVSDQIRNILYNQKVDHQIELLTGELRQKSFVDVKIEEFR